MSKQTIIFKENENGIIQLFDTRSMNFLPSCCVKDATASRDMLNLANMIARKPKKEIVELAQSPSYGEFGNAEHIIAKSYVNLNPDFLINVGKLNKPKVNNKMVRKGKRGRANNAPLNIPVIEAGEKRGRGRPRKSTEAVTPKNSEVTSETTSDQTVVKRGRGRPRKNPVEIDLTTPKRGRGRPRIHPIIEVDPNAPKRGRGRPRKNPVEIDLTTPKRGRGRPRIHPIKEVDPTAPKRGRGRPRKNPL